MAAGAATAGGLHRARTAPESVGIAMPSGINLEIIERTTDPEKAPVIVPNEVRINGAPVWTPKDSPIQIGDIDSNGLVLVTMTLAVRSLSIRAEAKETTDV